MESASTTSSTFFASHPLPHQQFSSRFAYTGNTNKIKLNNTLSNRKSTTRLPPISRCDSPTPITADTIDSNLNTGSIEMNEDLTIDMMDPMLRIKQLEKNLDFVKTNCHSILKCLHNELEDLKTKNRDLQFQLIISGSLSPQLTQSLVKEQVLIMALIKGCLPPQIGEHMNKLENEVKRLRFALRETLKMNSILRNETQKLEKDKQTVIQLNTSAGNSPLGSPAIGDFNMTFEQIYKIENRKQNTFSLPRITKSSK